MAAHQQHQEQQQLEHQEQRQQEAWPSVVFSSDFRDQIRRAKVLAVGAGGIGCELLKTLVLTGFQTIEVMDLDTIETSNLNRQFLFRRAHVGQSKAKVAAEVVQTFAPDANIKAYQANIKEARFGVEFFRGFDLVLNGLDNMDARRHVNRLCVAAGVPLVESGTAGYVGQVSVHIKGTTECYECQPRSAAQKSYPICTLRNTPDKPIHCVVWAKELLFPRLFGKAETSDLDEAAAAPTSTTALGPAANGAAGAPPADAAAESAAAAAAEAAEAASFFQQQEGEAALDYAVRVFERLYCTDIRKVCSMEELWKTRTPPTTLILPELLPDLVAALGDAAESSNASAARALGLKDQTLWSTADNARVFLACIVKFLTQRRAELGSALFDKDDALAVDFVTAASNLRAACYGIQQQSAFDAKGMAGNIIHAIATTNAIVGGIIVAEAIKLLAGHASRCVTSFLRTQPSTVGNRRTGRMQALISGELPSPPNPGCMVCGKAQLHLTANTASMTLQTLVDKVLKQRLAINLPSLHTEGGFWYEEGDDLDPDEAAESAALLPRALALLPGGGLVAGSILAVGDQSQAITLDLIVNHQDVIDLEKHPEGFILEGQLPAAAAAAQPDTQQPAAGAEQPAAASKKRTRAVAEAEVPAADDDAAAPVAADVNGSVGGQQLQHEAEAAADGEVGEQRGAKRHKADESAAAGVGTADEPVDLVSSEGGDGDDVIVLD